MPAMPNVIFASGLRSLSAVAAMTIATAFVSGCGRQGDKLPPALHRGLAENPQREKMGLRPIAVTWKCIRSSGGEDDWIADPKSDQAAVKTVKHDANGLPVWEVDRYWSGRLVVVDEGKDAEEITLQCDYTSQKLKLGYAYDDAEIKSWIRRAGPGNEECLEVIKRAKKKWGIK